MWERGGGLCGDKGQGRIVEQSRGAFEWEAAACEGVGDFFVCFRLGPIEVGMTQ